MTDYQLQAVAVGVTIDGKSVFDAVTLGVASGDLLVIAGASGSGKSTLAQVLCGVIEPDRGEVLLRGEPLRDVVDLQLRPAFVPQGFGLISSLTGLENVTLPLQVCRLDKLDARTRALGWLQRLGIEACANRQVGELSGGQRQRVGIARALALGTPVVVMDEPTAELDAANRDVVVSALAQERARGTALIVVSHDEDVVEGASEVIELQPARHL